MRFHLLFPTVKTAAFYYVPIESYSKNTQPFFILKRVLVRLYKLYLLQKKLDQKLKTKDVETSFKKG